MLQTKMREKTVAKKEKKMFNYLDGPHFSTDVLIQSMLLKKFQLCHNF